MTTEHVTIRPAPDESDGERFVRGQLHRTSAPEPEREQTKPRPARIPAGVRQPPPRPHPGSAWLRALHHEMLTGQPVDPSRFE